MFDRILHRMRECIRTSRYVVTPHAVDEMEADGLTVFDMEHCILTGSILERQRDRQTGEWKYVVEGNTLNHDNAQTVAKISPTAKLVIITVYLV